MYLQGNLSNEVTLYQKVYSIEKTSSAKFKDAQIGYLQQSREAAG